MTNTVNEEETAVEADVDGKSEAGEGVVVDERLAYRGVFQRLFVRPEIGAIVGAGAIWAFFWAVARDFGTAGGAASVLDTAATLGIMAVAVSLLMIGGEFDLSSGAATGALAITTILLVKDVGELGGAGLSLWVAIPISLLAALCLGWLNGTMVERTRLPSFIVTLATFFILRGFKLGFSKLTIDNLTVGPIEDGEGYEFWHPIFASVWTRTDHQLEIRDLIYTIGVVGGLALIAIAVADLNFSHKDRQNPAGLGVAAAGWAGVVAGILYMHNTDGVGANTTAAIIIGISGLVAFIGLGMWRFRRQAPGSVQFTSAVGLLTASGIVLTGLGMLLGRILRPGGWALELLNADSQDQVLDFARLMKWPIVLVVGLTAGYVAFRQASQGLATSQLAVRIVSVIALAAFAIYAFMFMTTVEGLRAIVMSAFVLGGLMLLAIAAVRAGRTSPVSRAVVLMLAAGATLAVAFYVRNESTATKFRSELFSVLLVAALAIAVWAIIATVFMTRSSPTDGNDRFGSILTKIGLAAVGIGMLVKLLYTTDAEIAGGVTPANFRISIAWFFGFTVLAVWVLGRTKFGSWIFAVGGNKDAARQIGVPAARTKTQLFMIVSVAAWLVGLLLAFRLSTVQSVAGNGLEFEYIIAAVVGGTLLTGGYGSAAGAAIGAIIMAMSKLGIPSARWNSDWRFAFLGLILLAAVIANNFIKTKAEASAR